MADDKTWTARFMAMCDLVASWSEDRDFKVGAVIVRAPGQVVVATGYNGFARGVSAADPARHDRPSGEKFHWFEHAERNAIYNAARTGAALQDCTLYVNRFPCADCGRAVIQSGISRLVCPPIPQADGALDHSFSVSHRMLTEAGLTVETYTPPA
jgi:dCMP deaminase